MRKRSSVRLCLLFLAVSACNQEPSVAPEIGPVFSDVTAAAGLSGFRHTNGGFGEAWAPEIVGGGGGFIDYDGDGWLDIMLVSGGPFRGRGGYRGPCLRLYKNQADGTFEEATEEAGLSVVGGYAFGITVGDYDNDGDPDIYVTTLYRDYLLRNDEGAFSEVGVDAGIGSISEWSSSAMFFDADRDGFLDLYVGTYVDWSPDKDIYCGFEGEKVYCTPSVYEGISGRYYHNNGDGTFDLLTEEAGFLSGIAPERDKTLGVAAYDINSDGWADVAIANDTERDLLFLNDGDGNFTEVGIRSGIAYDLHGTPRAGMGIDIGVVDGTQEPSWFVGNFSGEMVGVYRHIGDGLFMDRASTSLIGQPTLNTLTFGLFLFDMDLDSDLDLLVANGHVQTHIARIVEGATFRQRSQIFLNMGDGRFDELVPEGPMLNAMVARGAAYGDYDKDGDQDVLITENNGPAHLWRNESRNSRWLRVRVEGRESNRDGYGARIVVSADSLKMVREVRSGSSFLSHPETVATFGLGSSSNPDSITVYWPSGVTDHIHSVEANTEVRIIEGESHE